MAGIVRKKLRVFTHFSTIFHDFTHRSWPWLRDFTHFYGYGFIFNHGWTPMNTDEQEFLIFDLRFLIDGDAAIGETRQCRPVSPKPATSAAQSFRTAI